MLVLGSVITIAIKDLVLLMVQKSHSQPPGIYKNPSFLSWKILHINWLAGFLSHQQYDFQFPGACFDVLSLQGSAKVHITDRHQKPKVSSQAASWTVPDGTHRSTCKMPNTLVFSPRKLDPRSQQVGEFINFTQQKSYSSSCYEVFGDFCIYIYIYTPWKSTTIFYRLVSEPPLF